MFRARVMPAALVIAVTLAVIGCRKKEPPPAPPPRAVLVTPVAQRDVPLVSEYVAALDGFINVEIRARVAGFLEAQHYQEGTVVQQDQLLFTIDPRQYEAALAQAKGALARARASLQNAQVTVRRLRPLAQKLAVSRQDLDNAAAAEREARAQVQSAQATVEQAQLNLSWTRVRSPITGLAGVARVRIGNLVGQGQPTLLAIVSQLDPIRASFSITEREYLRMVKRAQPSDGGGLSFEGDGAQVRLVLADGSTYPPEGRFVIASRGVDPATGTLQLQALFPNPEGLLRPGQFGRVRLVTQTLRRALLIPQRAVREVQGSKLVGVVGPDDVVRIRPVELGPEVETEFVVQRGLAAGERVVIEGLAQVQDGQKVSVRSASPPTPAADAGTRPGVGGSGPADAGGGAR